MSDIILSILSVCLPVRDVVLYLKEWTYHQTFLDCLARASP